MIQVVSEVEPYELNGDTLFDVKSRKPSLTVKSHWNRKEFVVLKFGDDQSFTVNANDLEAAIRNATNSGTI